MDYHIYTTYSKDADPTMNLEGIVEKGCELGYASIGVCEHIFDRGEVEVYETIKQEINSLKKELKVYSGIEVVLQGLRGDLPLDEETCRMLDPDYVLGAVHGSYVGSYDRELIIARHHALLCKLAREKCIDVIAHPWWFPPKEFQHRRFPKFDDFSVVPGMAHNDLASICVGNKTAIEANAELIIFSEYYPKEFIEQYINYLKFMADKSVPICIGSGAHTITAIDKGKHLIKRLKMAGISEGCFWDPAMGKNSREKRKKALKQGNGNIVLVGFMGAGKTEVGKSLSRHLGMKFMDMDLVIEGREGRTIKEIFEQDGENFFRVVESEVCQEVPESENSVIATGGGVVLKRQNMYHLKTNSVVIHLSVDIEDVLKRTSEQTDRPLLNVPDVRKEIEKLILLRKPYYNQADWTVSTKDKKPSDIADEIIKTVGLES